jgi:hypothetical protein
LFGILNRSVSVHQHTFLIFDTYLNDKGDDVYYIAFFCDTQTRKFDKYEQTDSFVIGGEVMKRAIWSEEIDLDFLKNKVKKWRISN